MNNLIVCAIIWGIISVIILSQNIMNTYGLNQLNSKVNALNIDVCNIQGGECSSSDNLISNIYKNNWDYLTSFYILMGAIFMTVFVDSIGGKNEDDEEQSKRRNKIIGIVWATTITILVILELIIRIIIPNYDEDEDEDGYKYEKYNTSNFLVRYWPYMLLIIILLVLLWLTVFRASILEDEKMISIFWAVGLLIIGVSIGVWEGIYPKIIEDE